MRPVAWWALAVLVAAGTSPAWSVESRGLLRFAGQAVKWGGVSFGSGAVVTYARLERPRATLGARNCAEMLPLERLLAGSAIGADAFARELRAAFDVWAAVADIRFEEIRDSAAADIVVGAQAGTRGVAFTNVERDTVARGGIQPLVAATICLDPSKRWELHADGDPATYTLRPVLAHEIGHAIGLDHYGARGGVMGFAYVEDGPATAEVGLSVLDVAAVTRLYGPAVAPVLVAAPGLPDRCEVRGAITPTGCLSVEPAGAAEPIAATGSLGGTPPIRRAPSP